MKEQLIRLLLVISTVNFLAISAPILLGNKYLRWYFIKWINYIERNYNDERSERTRSVHE